MPDAALAARFKSVRARTESLCAPLAIEDYVIQAMENVSPPKWHLAHVTWFFELNADVYFAHHYHSWERGLNEDSNELLGQYFPKGVELIGVPKEQVQSAVDKLNHRPRKVLGFRIPFEIFFGKTVRYTIPPSGVALRN